MKSELVYKGESRCFVFDEKHIKIVNKIIKEISEFEHRYMPDD